MLFGRCNLGCFRWEECGRPSFGGDVFALHCDIVYVDSSEDDNFISSVINA